MSKLKDEIEAAAMDKPWIYEAMRMYRRGTTTWEETLEIMLTMTLEHLDKNNKLLLELVSKRTTLDWSAPPAGVATSSQSSSPASSPDASSACASAGTAGGA